MRRLLLPVLFLTLACVIHTHAQQNPPTPAVQGTINGKAELQTDNAGQPGNGTRGVRIKGAYYAGRPANSNKDDDVGKIVVSWERLENVAMRGQPEKRAWVPYPTNGDGLVPNVTGTPKGDYESNREDLVVDEAVGKRWKYRANVELYKLGFGSVEATTYVEYTFP